MPDYSDPFVARGLALRELGWTATPEQITAAAERLADVFDIDTDREAMAAVWELAQFLPSGVLTLPQGLREAAVRVGAISALEADDA